MKAKDLLKLANFPSILIYGVAGTGKTALVSQAKDSYMLDFDDGMRTAALLNDDFTSLRQACEFDTYVDQDPSHPTAYLKAERKIFELSKQSAAKQLKYRCIIIDSLSGLVKSMRLQVMTQAGDSFKQPQIQHWGIMVNETEKLLTILRSLNCLLIVTAHETTLEVDRENLIRPLSVTQKHSINNLMWLFDEVWHTSIRPAGQNKHKYIVSSNATGCIAARTRAGNTWSLDVTNVGLKAVLEKIKYEM